GVAAQGRPRLDDGVDQEQLLETARIAAGGVKRLGVLGPGDRRADLFVLVLLLRLLVGDGAADAAAEAAAGVEGVIGDAVLGQLHGRLFLAFFRQVEVVVQGVGVQFAVGRIDARVAPLAAEAALASLAAEAAALLLLGGFLAVDDRQGFLHVHVEVGEI